MVRPAGCFDTLTEGSDTSSFGVSTAGDVSLVPLRLRQGLNATVGHRCQSILPTFRYRVAC